MLGVPQGSLDGPHGFQNVLPVWRPRFVALLLRQFQVAERLPSGHRWQATEEEVIQGEGVPQGSLLQALDHPTKRQERPHQLQSRRQPVGATRVVGVVIFAACVFSFPGTRRGGNASEARPPVPEGGGRRVERSEDAGRRAVRTSTLRRALGTNARRSTHGHHSILIVDDGRQGRLGDVESIGQVAEVGGAAGVEQLQEEHLVVECESLSRSHVVHCLSGRLAPQVLR